MIVGRRHMERIGYYLLLSLSALGLLGAIVQFFVIFWNTAAILGGY
jgi:hypothetical protein